MLPVLPVLLVLCAPVLAGQSTGGAGVVRGEVVSAADERPVADAEVLLTIGSATRIARTDVRGSFSIGRVPAGRHGLQVRRLGYAPQSLPVDVRDDVTTVTVRLTPSPASVASWERIRR